MTEPVPGAIFVANMVLMLASVPSSSQPRERQDPLLPERPDPPLRSLASLKWPYVPEESAYPDPLKRDDPKPLQIPQYEAIGVLMNARELRLNGG